MPITDCDSWLREDKLKSRSKVHWRSRWRVWEGKENTLGGPDCWRNVTDDLKITLADLWTPHHMEKDHFSFRRITTHISYKLLHMLRWFLPVWCRFQRPVWRGKRAHPRFCHHHLDPSWHCIYLCVEGVDSVIWPLPCLSHLRPTCGHLQDKRDRKPQQGKSVCQWRPTHFQNEQVRDAV